MYSIREEEKDLYELFMTKVACCIMREGEKNILALGAPTQEELVAAYKELGMATGQVTLDKVIELTIDMPQDQVIRFMAEMASSVVVKMMNEKPSFRQKIKFLSNIL